MVFELNGTGHASVSKKNYKHLMKLLHISTVDDGPVLEFSIGDQYRFEQMYTPALEVVDGKVKIPDEGYGWGVTIREEWLKSAEY